METINVGGRLFSTLRSTLTKYEDSFLAKIISSPNPIRDGDGHIFIDSDPNNFAVILNYLRRGQAEMNESVLSDLEYFGIDYVEDLLSTNAPRMDALYSFNIGGESVKLLFSERAASGSNRQEDLKIDHDISGEYYLKLLKDNVPEKDLKKIINKGKHFVVRVGFNKIIIARETRSFTQRLVESGLKTYFRTLDGVGMLSGHKIFKKNGVTYIEVSPEEYDAYGEDVDQFEWKKLMVSKRIVNPDTFFD